ncbi:MAG: DUF4113 domain-containing protein [Candidatus Moranbacteria bacterium]|nr:DUF4113 domain-containing protein [Candidatus Moranbacteria bacterium]
MKQVFFLVDCNNFYAACEQIFNPGLRNKPVIVLSNNDGCVVARSNQVKELGIKLGTPVFKLEHLIKRFNIELLSSNYALYADMSRRVMKTLSALADEIEVYSIDEAFIGLKTDPDKVLAYAGKLKKIVERNTGISVSIGIGQTKTLAKIANKIAKKQARWQGIFDLSQTSNMELDKILRTIKIADIWGIGPKSTDWLCSKGIKTAKDLKHFKDQGLLKKKLKINGFFTWRELWRESCIKLQQGLVGKKQIVASRSFGKKVNTLKELEQALASYATTAAQKMRGQKSAAGMLIVFLGTNRFKVKEPQYFNSMVKFLQQPTAYTPKIIKTAFETLRYLYRPGYNYKKIGIVLGNFQPLGLAQTDLFGQFKKAAGRNRLMQVVDRINQQWGSSTLRYAACGIEKAWQMKQLRKSPRYTTSWEELPVVKA